SLLIESFCKWKGSNYNPPLTHSAIKWSLSDPYNLEKDDPLPWTIIGSTKTQAGRKAASSTKRDTTATTLSKNTSKSPANALSLSTTAIPLLQIHVQAP
ncbi:uncharacterized protein C8R40DRAFT_1025132, partial [Lentinula edodes]|uniref:uncharacterized protein n=1 Tax=Lentinula edodes TaxID=5353 RepID=UPI001E8E5132